MKFVLDTWKFFGKYQLLEKYLAFIVIESSLTTQSQLIPIWEVFTRNTHTYIHTYAYICIQNWHDLKKQSCHQNFWAFLFCMLYREAVAEMNVYWFLKKTQNNFKANSQLWNCNLGSDSLIPWWNHSMDNMTLGKRRIRQAHKIDSQSPLCNIY